MAQPYLGQIEAFAFNYAPRGWAMCAGQLLPIAQNQALFSVLGTTYGGDGRITFGLPDLRSRVAVGQGNGNGLTSRTIGQSFGEETHTVTLLETPLHSHSLNVAANAAPASNTNIPANTVVLAQSTAKDKNGNTITLDLYAPDTTPSQTMAGSSLGSTGGQPHANIMPLTALSFCIALQGVFPTRN
jgi:microcystin-dependent protein